MDAKSNGAMPALAKLKKTLARLFFCGAPAFAVFAAATFAMNYAVGVIFACCVFGLGWDVTKERRNG